MTGKTEAISRREFARRDGCHEKLVRDAIRDGHLVELQGGGLDPALVGTGWRKGNRRRAEKGAEAGAELGAEAASEVRKLRSSAAPAPAAETAGADCAGSLPEQASSLSALADGSAGDAAIVMLRHLPMSTVRPLVAELLAAARRGAVEMLEDDDTPLPPGVARWADHPAFTRASPTEDEWAEAAELAKAGTPI